MRCAITRGTSTSQPYNVKIYQVVREPCRTRTGGWRAGDKSKKKYYFRKLNNRMTLLVQRRLQTDAASRIPSSEKIQVKKEAPVSTLRFRRFLTKYVIKREKVQQH